jgi:hypothetical protein
MSTRPAVIDGAVSELFADGDERHREDSRSQFGPRDGRVRLFDDNPHIGSTCRGFVR